MRKCESCREKIEQKRRAGKLNKKIILIRVTSVPAFHRPRFSVQVHIKRYKHINIRISVYNIYIILQSSVPHTNIDRYIIYIYEAFVRRRA